MVCDPEGTAKIAGFTRLNTAHYDDSSAMKPVAVKAKRGLRTVWCCCRERRANNAVTWQRQAPSIARCLMSFH